MTLVLLEKKFSQRLADNTDLVDGFNNALDQSYSAIRDAAAREWQRRFGASDPSDACVSVRITGFGSRTLAA